MKINYRLEIHYSGIDENGNKIDRYDNVIFDSKNSIENRNSVFKEYQNYSDIFEDALKFGKLKMSWEEILSRKLKEYHIPTMNIYYSYDENEDFVLFGNLLENFEERMEELQDELRVYEENQIPFEHETVTDIDDNMYTIIKGSLLSENDVEIVKNVC